MAIELGAGRGKADEIPGVSVRWIAPPTCPGAAELRARIHRLLPADSAATSTDRLLAEGTVQSVNGRYRLTLSVGRERDSSRVTRVFESDSCESLAGAAAVTLALLVGGARAVPRRDEGSSARASGAPTPALPTAEGTTRAAPSEPPATQPPASRENKPHESTPQESTPQESTERPREAMEQPPGEARTSTLPSAERRWAPAVEGPLVAMDEGLLPSWSYGLGLGIGVHASRVRVMLTGVLWLPQDGSPAGSPYTGTYERRSGGLSGCYAWPVGPFDLGPCLRLTVEDVTGSGSGPDVMGASGHASWLTVGLAARAGWSIRRWVAVFLRPTLALTTARPRFAIDGVGPLYQVPLISGGVDLGCEWIL